MEKIQGCYYLHVNGELIWKPKGVFYNTTPQDYFDSNFVVKWWAIPESSPTGTTSGDLMFLMDLFLEAYMLSKEKEKTSEAIYRICRKNGFSDNIPKAIIEEGVKRENAKF